MNRLTYNIAGGGNYRYGTAPIHGVTSTVTGGVTQDSASYDAVGDMICRAPTSATTCTGTVTGQQMTYDAERRLAHWQSDPTSTPTNRADELYDGSGQRVEQVDTNANTGTTTTVYYLLGGLEEVSSSGSSSTLTKYYRAAGVRIGVNVGGTISYLASDGLGSVSEAFDGAGNVTAAQLFAPYGGVRYSSGTMPTSKAFTGQRSDAATSGLDYYGARYYDPLLGQFTTADTKQGPNRYAYVADDPETLTDPTGNCMQIAGRDSSCGGGGGGSDGGGSCHSDASCGCYASGCDGGNNSGGNHSGRGCNPDSPSASPTCKAWAYWAEKARTAKLSQLDSDAQTWVIVSFVLEALAIITAIVSGNAVLAILEGALDLIDLVANKLIPAIGKKIADDGGNGNAALAAAYKLSTVLNEASGLIQTAIGWYQTADWIMQMAINGAVMAVKTVAGGAEQVLVDVTWQAAGGAASLLMNGFADQAMAAADAEFGEEAYQNSLSINDWCSQYGGGACGTPPSS